MDAILKRSKTQYILCVRKEFINNFKSSLDTTYGWVVADEYGGDILKLSLKNCQAIACGYDLDELAYTLANKEYTYEKHLKSAVSPLKIGFKQGFKSGFQKALEILGDK